MRKGIQALCAVSSIGFALALIRCGSIVVCQYLIGVPDTYTSPQGSGKQS